MGSVARTVPRFWAQPHTRWLVVILLVALVLRIFWVASVQPDPRDGRLDDTVLYHGGGRGLADGDGYINPYSGLPTARWSIGYPLVLSPLYLLPGDDVAAARGLNVAAGLIMVAGVYYIGQRLWDKRAGLLAAALIALFPSAIFFSTLVLSEVVYAACAVGVLALALAWTTPGPPPARRLLLLGLALGGTALVRPEGIVFVGVLGVFWWVHGRDWRPAAKNVALVLVGVAVLFIPWTVRNAVELGSPVVGTTGLGGVLIQGHSPDSDGQPNFGIQVALENRFLDVELPEREVRVNNAGIQDSLEFAVNNLGPEVRLTALRFTYFVRSDRGAIDWVQHAPLPSTDSEGQPVAGQRALSASTARALGLVSDLYYYAALGIALAGVPFVLKQRRPEHILLLLPVLVYLSLWSLLFVSESRYHFPLLPFVSIAAAIGAIAAYDVVREQQAERRQASRATGGP
ncbi:MAG: glycosyltransferase family 39 protein [Dehalococcoidia bacterium]